MSHSLYLIKQHTVKTVVLILHTTAPHLTGNFNGEFFKCRFWLRSSEVGLQICIFFFLKELLYLLIYFWLCWVFVSVWGLSLVAASGGHSSSRCAGLSLSRPLLLRSTGSRHAGLVIVAQAQLLRGMWDLPRPGLEPVSPALAGRLSTTAPPGKPRSAF